MTSASGWYPDPAGTAQLRFWDGQDWSSETAAPAAPVAPAAPIAEGYAPEPTFAAAPLSSKPGFAGSPAVRPRSAPPGRGPGRGRSFYGLAAGAVGVAAVVAVVLSSTISKTSPAPSVPSVTTSTAPRPGSLAMPATFAGLTRITGTQAAKLKGDAADTWPLHTPYLTGFYGQGQNGQPHLSALAGNVQLTPGNMRRLVSSFEKSLNNAGAQLTFRAEPTGAYGGVMQCGYQPASPAVGPASSLCVFADSTSFGVLYVEGLAVPSTRKAIALRAVLETPPLRS